RDEKELQEVKNYFKNIEFYSGLCINDNKTIFMPWRDSVTRSVQWNNYIKFPYLGIIVNQDGTVCWSNIKDKFSKRIDQLQNVWWRNKTLEYKIRMLNSYVISVL